MERNGWQAKIVATFKGPAEGAVILSLEYEDTTREMVVALQNKLAQLGIALNEGK